MSLRAVALLAPSLVIGLLAFNGAGDRTVGPPDRVPQGEGAAGGSAVLRGRVLLPDDGSPLGLRAHLMTPGYRDSVDVDAAGGFVFAVPAVACDSLDLLLDPTNETVRRYHSARLRVAVPAAGDSALEAVRALLVPTTFTISGGTYARITIPIAIDAAVAGSGFRSRYWRVSTSASSRGVPVGWPDERFPLPLAVTAEFAPMRSADSARVWTIARDLERDFGRTLFRPISLDSARNEGWSVTLSLDPREESPGITFIAYDGRGDLFDATIAIRSPALLTDPRVVTHELLHALGFGHSVGWHSVMGSPYGAPARATAADVAYAQLFYRMRRVHLEERATHGILASTGGSAQRTRQPTRAVSTERCSRRAEPPWTGKS